MYIEALKAFEQAITYAPADETLHYLSGVNAAHAAKAMHDYRPDGAAGAQAAAYLATAEAAYLSALDQAGDYSSARYALANLYAFELNKPEQAVFHLLRYMEGRSGDADAMFVMARSQYMLGRYREALDWYDQGIALTRDDKKKDQARANRALIEGLL